MVILQQYHLRTWGLATVALTAALALTGCASDDENVVDEVPAEPQEVVRIGVAMSSPGLVSGINPSDVSGAEVDFIAAVTDRMETLPPNVEIVWVPTTADTVAEALGTGEIDIAVGQFSGSTFSDDTARVGPYATVQPGLIVHQEPQGDALPLEALQPAPVNSLAELADASVCVVAGSRAAHTDIGEAVVEATVTECEVGMRSGRYDAIAADDLQLAGLLLDPEFTARYELLLWSDLAAETDDEEAHADVDESLFETRQYWLGVNSTYCADTAEAVEIVVADGVIADLFEPWDEVESFQLEPVDAEELNAQNCDAEL